MNTIGNAFVLLSLIATVCVNAQWTPATVINGEEVQYVAYTNSALYAATLSYGLYRSTNNGTDWTSVKITPSGGIVTSIVSNGEKIFAATLGTGIFLSTNNGTTWTAINTGLPSKFVYALTLSGTTLFASVGGVYRASVSDTVWTALSLNLTNKFVLKLTVSDGNLFASTTDSVFRSTDNGDHWTSASAGLNFSHGDAFYASGSTLFRGGFEGLYRSTNYGALWENLNLSFMQNWVNGISSYGLNIFIGFKFGGVAVSPNNGTTWSQNNTGMYLGGISSLAVSGTHLFVVNDLQVWSRPLSQITSISDRSFVVPEQMELQQNFPNPFNPTTTFSFSIPSRSFVSLKLYDTMGRELTTLFSEELPPGLHHKQWDASGFPSGTYFYRLQAGSITKTKTLLLVK